MRKKKVELSRWMPLTMAVGKMALNETFICLFYLESMCAAHSKTQMDKE